MSLHIAYDHQCAGCQAHYIPYEAVPCPRCGIVETERFDFIPQAVASLRANQAKWGSYSPAAWWVGSLGDHFLHLLFGLFDAFAISAPDVLFGTYAAKYLDRIDWGDQEYLKGHLHGIALRVREELTRLPPPKRRYALPFQKHPPLTVVPYMAGWVRCPSCGKRFALSNPDSWDGTRHQTCGQLLKVGG